MLKILFSLFFCFAQLNCVYAQNYVIKNDSIGFHLELNNQHILRYRPFVSTQPCQVEIKVKGKILVICEKITGYFGRNLQIHIFDLNYYENVDSPMKYFGETELIGIDWIDKEVKIEISRKKIGVKVEKKLIFLRYLKELSHTPNQKWLR